MRDLLRPRPPPEPAGYGDAGPLLNDYFLAARRLVEAGVRVMTLSYWLAGTGLRQSRGGPRSKTPGITCRCSRCGLTCATTPDDLRRARASNWADVGRLAWGEFGRTPKINKEGGRDHWPSVACALLAGGEMKTGQVIGSTDWLADHAKDNPVHFQEVFATLYHNLWASICPRPR